MQAPQNFTVICDTQRRLDGLTAATNDYNQMMRANDPGFIALSEAQYLQFVMESAFDSYAIHYGIV